MTGRNPGRHGVFGFVTERPGSGETSLVSLGSVRGVKLWDAFVTAGRKVGVVNVPITYPAPEVDGVFVSGMLTPPGRPYTWPPDFQAEMETAAPEYRIDIDRGLFDDPETFLEHLHTTADARATVIRKVMDNVDWDLLVGVFTNTDRIQHHFWRKGMDEIRGFYRRVDDHLGAILDAAPDDATVIVLSDHGFTSTDRSFYANRWLRREGYLRTRRVAGPVDDYERRRFNWFMGEPEEARRREGLGARILRGFGLGADVAIDWERTRAYLYSSDTRGIHVNLEGRQPQGVVKESEYESLRDEIVEKLLALRFPGTGEPVFDRVLRREEVYEGPYVSSAPDILTVPERDRYRIVSKVAGDRSFRTHRVPGGYHRGPGLLLVRGPGVRKGEEIVGAEITDVLPTVLFAAGLPIPERADGKVLRDLFTEEFLAGRALTEEEDEALRRTLKGLGYL
jgi:predicted AlkP superfamily phosphohydrolase/phosphomutase